jgi:multidrug efflux pump subunit AcrB
VGHRNDELAVGAVRLSVEMRAPGTVEPRDQLDLAAVCFEALELECGNVARGAPRRGLARNDVARALLGRTRGLEVGQFRAGDDPVPIYVRAPEGDETTLDSLHTLPVAIPGRDPTPMGQLAHPDVRWRPAAIRHRNRERIVSVLAQVEHGVAASQVIRALQARLTRSRRRSCSSTADCMP